MQRLTRTAALPTTKTAVAAILRADPALDGDSVAAIMAILNGKGDKATDTPTARRLYKRGEVAKLAGITPISVDRYSRLGYLQRVRLGDSKRASGYTAESVERFLAGRATMNEDGDTAVTGEV